MPFGQPGTVLIDRSTDAQGNLQLPSFPEGGHVTDTHRAVIIAGVK